MNGSGPSAAGRPVLVLGVGNVLLGDEGVGVHAVRRLEQESWPAHVTLLDGGTGGFHLLSLFQEYERIVLVDATMDGAPPGTVRVTRPRFASDYPKTLSAHDIGLKDLVESAALLGHAPEIVLIVISVKTLPEGLHAELSPEVAASLPRVAELVREAVEA
jgi:hydrogenase maturation protease